MTPEEALALAKTVGDIYAQATTQLVQAISRSVRRGVENPDRSGLAEILRLRAEAQQVLLYLRSATRDEIPSLLGRVYAAQAGATVNPRAVVALAEDTIRLLDATTPHVLRWTEDTFRAAVAEAAGPLVAGVVDRRAAAATVVDRLTRSGQTGFTDAAGRKWGLDTYAEQATRTAVGRAHLNGTLAGYAEQGRTYVIISDSPEECPQCRPYEGAILSLGSDTPPPDLTGLRYAGTLNSAIGHGLFHPNCTHRANAFVPGLTKPMVGTENPDGYLARQRQRELERRVRESKRRVEGIRPLGDTPEARRQVQLLKDRRTALKTFNAENDRKQHVSDRRTSTTSR